MSTKIIDNTEKTHDWIIKSLVNFIAVPDLTKTLRSRYSTPQTCGKPFHHCVTVTLLAVVNACLIFFQLFFLESCTWYLKDCIQSSLQNDKGNIFREFFFKKEKKYFICIVIIKFCMCHCLLIQDEEKNNKQTNKTPVKTKMKPSLRYTFELWLVVNWRIIMDRLFRGAQIDFQQDSLSVLLKAWKHT